MTANKPSLGNQAGKSALWQIGGGGWQTFVRLGASVFLSRALTPYEFGIFGMALLFNEFLSHIGAIGMGTGIIAKANVNNSDLNTYFWIMTLAKVIMFLLALASAPIAAWFFKEPLLTDIIRVISSIFLISIFSVVSETLLSKKIQFKTINIIRSTGALIESALAVILAIKTDMGYWALVLSMITNAIFTNISIAVASQWYPKFEFSKESFDYLFRFGINGLGFSITNYLRQNFDYYLVGRLMGSSALGLYEFAYRIPHLVLDRIARPVGAVAFPYIASMQNENVKLIEGYISVVKYVCLIAFPLLFGIAAIAEILVPFLWGDQWLSIITPLRLLCLCAVLRMIPQPLGSIFNCKNRPDLPFKISLAGLVWTTFIVSLFGFLYGLNGVAMGMVLSVAEGYVALAIAFKLTKQSMSPLIKAVLPILISSGGCALSAFGVIEILQLLNLPTALTLLLSIVTGAAFYFLILTFRFPIFAKELIDVSEQLLGSNKLFTLVKKIIQVN